jgi:hypothetical protein
MFKLLKTNQLLVEGSYGKAWVRLRRTDAAWSSLTDVTDAFRQAIATLRRLDFAKMGLLVDMRRAPLNSDPAFERAVKEQIQAMPPFKKMAMLVQTAVGKAQVTRVNREVGLTTMRLFLDEAEAIAYLEAK